ncbi:PAS domain-containing sensor histidine kinase [Hymenobacter persicinus]|uniref:histidine kinase n=1 Tax=Hymenobacter persicinus TaxID=2025506 RepID=A0A4Q5L9D7_9BACT|nr:PAS domain-containing protein [Hymenobacter persicinus]RYU76730.1 PAS domain S-box protein [Hymenobacter persicinus]
MIPPSPFEQMLRQLQAGVATLVGPDLRYGFINEQMRELVGPAEPGQLVNEAPGRLPPVLLEMLPRIHATGTAHTAKACPCGPEHCYDLSVQPYHDEQGRVAGLLLMAVDVREQEQARQRAHELALTTRHLDARLRVLTETAPLMTFTTDAAGQVTYVSPQWYRFTGQPPTADLTAIWPLLVHPDDRLRVLFEAEAARRTGTGWSFEYRLRRYDGVYRWLLSRALPEVHPPDAPVFWHGALTEVHLERELSEARRRGEAELRFLADSIPELVWTASAEGLVEYYNQFTIDYTGLTKEELGPTGWVGLLYQHEQAAAARRWVQSVASGEDFEGEYRLRRHDGVYRWHTIRARQLSDGSGPRWFGTCSDVEEQYRLRQVLQTQYDELSRAHHNLDTFVYAASHDLRQPTNNLRGLFEELRRSVTFADPEQTQMLEMVDTALTELDSTLIDLATTVRTQRQQQEPVEVLDMTLMLEEILLGLRPEIMQRGARIDVQVGEAPGLRYSRANLRSVVHNLVSNSLKFSHPSRPPHIVLRSYLTPEGEPVLEVRDNGLGMHLDDPAHPTFQLFARQHTHVDGTGVGLYLVQRIVSSQGGHLAVTSVIGEGTTFTIHWTTTDSPA